MPVAGGGFEQCCNAQATTAAGSMPVVAADVVRDTSDRQQITPALEALTRLPEAPGAPETLLADSGCFSEASVDACADAGVEPLISPGRERHHLSLEDRFAEAPPAPEAPTPPEAMVHRLATPPGRALQALRRQTPEPVFGIIRSVMGFRRFSLRGLEQVGGEWNLVTPAWNIRRMFAPRPVCQARQAPDHPRQAPDPVTSSPVDLSAPPFASTGPTAPLLAEGAGSWPEAATPLFARW